MGGFCPVRWSSIVEGLVPTGQPCLVLKTNIKVLKTLYICKHKSICVCQKIDRMTRRANTRSSSPEEVPPDKSFTKKLLLSTSFFFSKPIFSPYFSSTAIFPSSSLSTTIFSHYFLLLFSLLKALQPYQPQNWREGFNQMYEAVKLPDILLITADIPSLTRFILRYLASYFFTGGLKFSQ